MTAILYLLCSLGLIVLQRSPCDATRMNICSPCQPSHPRPRFLDISTHLQNFIDQLGVISGSMARTLHDFYEQIAIIWGCQGIDDIRVIHEMEDRDEEYPALPSSNQCGRNRLSEELVSAYRLLTDVLANLTVADNLSVSQGLHQNHAHLRPSLCQLWLTLAGLGHHAPCTMCSSQIRIPNDPVGFSDDMRASVNYFYISYKRAIQTVDTMRNHFSH